MPNHFQKFLFILFIGLSAPLYSQWKFEGKVLDKNTKQGLAFVNVFIDKTTIGVLSDINGSFSLLIPDSILNTKVKFRYVAYETQTIEVVKEMTEERIVYLNPYGNLLNEIVIKPKENPALKIVRKAEINREMNNPEKLTSFTYTSYSKMIVTADQYADFDSIHSYDSKNQNAMQKFFSNKHLFITESVSERSYKFPGLNHEKVLAAKTSGFKSTPFTLLATQLQSFSFYTDWVNVLDIAYLNPVSGPGLKKYLFTLEDTLFLEKDSIYIISFKPKKEKNFRALKGVLYIHSDAYAIQNVIAEPDEAESDVTVKIQQMYEKLENKYWFPVQLNAEWIYKNFSLKDSKSGNTAKLKSISKSYIKEVNFNPVFKRGTFTELELSNDKDMDKKSDVFWDKYRNDSLSAKDRLTYHVIDSIGKSNHFDRKLTILDALLTGNIKMGKLNLGIADVINYNEYEGYRLGLGLSTNNDLVRFMKISAYGAYGFRDKAFKYGGSVVFHILKKNEMDLEFGYKNDVTESAAFYPEKQISLLVGESSYRKLAVYLMDKVESYEVNYRIRLFKYYKLKLFTNQRIIDSKVSFLSLEPGNNQPISVFNVNESGLECKFLFREKFVETFGRKISMGSKYPELKLRYSKGWKGKWFTEEGQFSYDKIEAKLNWNYRLGTYGRHYFTLLAGQVTGNIPYSLLFNGIGNRYYQFGISGENTFETMRMNEFISDRYAALFFTYSFGKFLPKNKIFNPDLELVQHAAIGNLKNSKGIYGIGIKTLENGYLEAGLKMRNILVSNFSGIGLGIFYRYGPNALSSNKDNFTFKINLTTTLIQ